MNKRSNFLSLYYKLFSFYTALILCSCNGNVTVFELAESEASTDTATDSDTETETDTNSDSEGTSSDSGIQSDTFPGLAGQYFARYNFADFVSCRHDPQIQFSWNDTPPMGLDPKGAISVRWQGWVTPDYSGTYTFSTLSDDGVRLWVNEAPLIDEWYLHTETTGEAEIGLTQGEPVPIVVEFFSAPSNSSIELYWEHASQVSQIIPTENLHAVACEAPAVVAPAPIVAEPCLQPDNFDDGILNSVWQANGLQPIEGIDVVENGNVSIVADSGFRFRLSVDAGAYLAQPITGDVDFQFLVSAIAGESTAEMGLMIRENWESDGPMAFIGIAANNEVHFLARNGINIPPTLIVSNSPEISIPSFPYWLRLRYSAETVEGFISGDGETWESMGTASLPLPTAYLAGIAQGSGARPQRIATGTGDDFRVNIGSCE